jgi:hypothetical protein
MVTTAVGDVVGTAGYAAVHASNILSHAQGVAQSQNLAQASVQLMRLKANYEALKTHLRVLPIDARELVDSIRQNIEHLKDALSRKDHKMNKVDNFDEDSLNREEIEGALTDIEAQILDLNKKLEEAGVGSVRDDSKTPIMVPPAEDFDETVANIAKRDRCTRQVALAKARHENPEAFEAYQSGPVNEDFDRLVELELATGVSLDIAKQRVGIKHPGAAASVMAKQEKTPFETEVDNIQEQDGCSRSEAMARARKKHPVKFAHYNEIA